MCRRTIKVSQGQRRVGFPVDRTRIYGTSAFDYAAEDEWVRS